MDFAAKERIVEFSGALFTAIEIPIWAQVLKNLIISFDKTFIRFELLDGTTKNIRDNDTINERLTEEDGVGDRPPRFCIFYRPSLGVSQRPISRRDVKL
ncbi:hypothetical protein NCU16741 [Neurospora crassa OR74A]|uniref:Uncharacterized protein n=1 Tax=Neurospora crassa (strain ATCC 24698 / 74-OR23-1A / CBS 708.71 / DSM 1257 / FGSC 987) TaxID=367110 RepID=V5INN1_NEUCR|nr:hypothetical protein NCU16741 [Neurospora crassa OR74A]ESA42769.1 hypothetical protein NCU16741 [Neurospora crassa OR74A]|eukprot:XP_011394361.1 hypothetical protein NCU16741 [Neurospora crassa OR74A]